MVVTIEQRTAITNQFIDGWMPHTKTVDNRTFIKCSWKDREFFKFCTGGSIKFGQKYQCQHKTETFEKLVKACRQASQRSFAAKQKEIWTDQHLAKKARLRACKDTDAEASGNIVRVKLNHDSSNAQFDVLFGTSAVHVWVEADVDALEFLQVAIGSDYREGTFARTRRGSAPMRAPPASEEQDSEEEDDEADDTDTD